MALSFGWRANDVRESIWMDDPAIPRKWVKRRDKDGKEVDVEVADIPAGALDAWREDGDASHLQPYATLGDPTIIRFRSLTPDEKHIVTAPMTVEDTAGVTGYMRMLLLCFRIGADFDAAAEQITDADGVKHKLIGKAWGTRMLAEPLVADIEERYPGLVYFYGRLIYDASYLTHIEKKASSPPSTATPSLAAVSTAVTTEPPPPPGDATGAP